MADAEHATIGLWEALCRTCPHWTLDMVSADKEGRDIGCCSWLDHWLTGHDGEFYTPEDHFCAEHPLIMTTRQQHREIVDARIAKANEADA